MLEKNLVTIEDKIDENNLLLKELLREVKSLKSHKGMINTRVKAAEYIGTDAQTIDTLIKEGRIINYGRERLYLFRKSELEDLREVRFNVQN